MSFNSAPWVKQQARAAAKKWYWLAGTWHSWAMVVAKSLRSALLGVGLVACTSGCDDPWHKATDRRLAHSHDQGDELGAHAPPPDGPKLGILSDFAAVYEKPERNSRRLGWLHAGAQVPRSTSAYPGSNCPAGWYAIHPRGYVCTGESATLDLKHPTLTAMGLMPKLNEPLPYPYAQARVGTEVFAPNNEPEPAVHAIARLRPAATFAVVGSWQAVDETDQRLKLAMMTGGTFVRAEDLRAAEVATSLGVPLDDGRLSLPLLFIVSDHARTWHLTGDQATPQTSLSRGSAWHVGQRARLLGDARYYPLADGSWIQESDATLVHLRNDWPSFATGTRHWIDVCLDSGTVVLYAGQHAVFAALALATPKMRTLKSLSEAEVIAKYVTDKHLDPKSLDAQREVYDVPWVVELSNGLLLHGAVGRERRGTEVGAPRAELTPADAQRVWAWAEPPLPAGWHAVTASLDPDHRTPVIVR